MAKAKKSTTKVRAKTRASARTAARKASARKKASAPKTSGAKAAAKQPAAGKSFAPKSLARKTLAHKPPARRKPATATRTRVPAASTRPPQTVAISHYNNADFESGLRTYAQYRDLGIVEASNGLVRAHVLRFTEPCDPEVVSKLHFHDTEFQMVYVLKGWVKTELEGEGEIMMRQGSAWTQPPKVRHKINDYSEDAELLEIILPADFETVELAG